MKQTAMQSKLQNQINILTFENEELKTKINFTEENGVPPEYNFEYEHHNISLGDHVILRNIQIDSDQSITRLKGINQTLQNDNDDLKNSIHSIEKEHKI